MARKRKFSFRIPWITSASSSKSPKHSHSTISIQGSPRKGVQKQSPPHSPKRRTSSELPILTSPQGGVQIHFSSSPSPSSTPSPSPSPSPSPPPSPSRVTPKSQGSPVSLSPDSGKKSDSKPGSPSRVTSKSQASPVSLSPNSEKKPDSKSGSPSHSPSKRNNVVLKPKVEGSTQLLSSVSNAQPASQPQSPSLLASKLTNEGLKPIAEKSTRLQSPPASQPQSPSLLASKPTNDVLKPIARSSTHLQSSPTSQPPSPLASKKTSGVIEPIAEKSTESQSQSPISNTKSASQPQYPSHLASKPTNEVSKTTPEERAELAFPVSNTQPASQPSNPTGEVLKLTAEESTKLESPLSNTQAASPSRLASKPSSEVSKPASFVSQQQKEKLTSSEPKMKSPLKAIPKSQEQNQPETSNRLSTQLTRMPRDKEASSTNRNSKSPVDSQSKFRKPQEKEKVAPRPIKEAKANDPTSSQPNRRRTTKLDTTASTSSATQSNQISKAFQPDKKTEETTERKLMFSTSNPSGNDLKVVSSTEPTNKKISTISLQKDIREGVSKFVQKLADDHPKQDIDDDRSVSIITIAGDNRGATMQIGSESSKKEESVHIHRAYKANPEESPEVTSDDEEESSEEESGNEEDEKGKAYINSNVQSINNSLMFHGSINERDPGVQLTFPQNKPENAQKADEKPVLMTHKLTYQPTVRRRCLRGLFLEPSDSDPDNPEKPRRHGCKFSCGGNKKDTDMEIM